MFIVDLNSCVCHARAWEQFLRPQLKPLTVRDFWPWHSKELKGHDLRLNIKGIYELGSRSILTVVSLLDCCLLAAPLSQLTSVFVFINSSTTNRFFLHDFVANNFVPGENCYKDLCFMNRTCSL